MTEENFQTCCRLCLGEKADFMKSVFDDSTAETGLHVRIQTHLSVKIATNDKLSTMVCSECINKLDSWHQYKEQCAENQNKLAQWLNTRNGNESVNTSFTIKEELVSDEEPELTEEKENPEVRIKTEPMDESFQELPPPLTPQTEELINGNMDSVDKRCSFCDKMFSTVGNRKKHEKMIHKNKPGPVTNGTASMDELSQSSQDSQEDANADLQKIQFAAGLKLLEKNTTPIEFEALSKIEFSYLEKCRAMASMHNTLVCACHKVKHPSIKGLLTHCRAMRIWFPVFTCYSCMITFTDRSSFAKHYVRCPKKNLDALIHLSNLRKRSKIKTRIYQNFKCTACKFMFAFHSDYCKHVGEEHCKEEGPLVCSCTREFTDIEEYKDHVYVSCLVEFYCDICFETFSTLDGFQKHAQQMHDNAEGFVLLQDDNYRNRKSNSKSPEKEAEKEDPSFMVTGKRKSSFYRSEKPEVEEEEPPSKVKFTRPVVPNKKGPCSCPICGKEYSTYNNMLRHYKMHIDENGEVKTQDTLFTCPDCGGMYSLVEWQKHIMECHEDKPCGECHKTFKFQTELDQHRSVHLNLKVYRDSKTKSYKSTMLSPTQTEAAEDLNCDYCDYVATSEEDIEEHRMGHDMMPILEPETELREMKGVVKEIKESKYCCKLCNKQYAGYGGLWDHNRKKHPENKTPQAKDFPKQCKYCEKIFYTGGSYFMHRQMHERMAHVALEATNNKLPTPVKSPTKKKNKEENEEEDGEGDESYHTCKKCFKVFSSKYNFKIHMKSHGLNLAVTQKPGLKTTKKRVWCDVCHIPCDNQESLAKHKQEEHSLENEETNQNEGLLDVKASVPIVFTCDVCVMTFNSKVALKKHKESHGNLKPNPLKSNITVFCKYCKLSFNSIPSLSNHMRDEHDEVFGKGQGKPKDKVKEKSSCKICKKSFNSSSGLQAHIGWHKRGTLLSDMKAAKMEKIIVKKVNAVKAAQKEITPPEFQCSTCLAELPNDTALQIHILEKHRNINAIMLIPRCGICDLDFKSQEEYDTHKRFHDFLDRQKKEGKNQIQLLPSKGSKYNKAFRCSLCPAAFNRSDNLSAHVRTVHKTSFKKEFNCNQCDRSFDKASSLNIHLKVHEKQKSVTPPIPSKPLFSCSICNMGFNVPKDLREHTISAHPF